jgi:hypothetical protein
MRIFEAILRTDAVISKLTSRNSPSTFGFHSALLPEYLGRFSSRERRTNRLHPRSINEQPKASSIGFSVKA